MLPSLDLVCAASELSAELRVGPPGTVLRLCLMHPTTPKLSRASVLIVHGYGEHMGRYDEVAQAWIKAGFSVGRFDLRGHGQSGGPRGHIQRFHDYTNDLREVLTRLARDARWAVNGPPILFGHSLGALIAVHYALEHQSELKGLAMTSPFLQLTQPASVAIRGLAQVMSRLWPSFSQPNRIKGELLTHDTQLARRHATDPLIQHQHPTQTGHNRSHIVSH